MRAIVIDDSRAMRGILKRILVGSGFDVTEAADGQQALTMLGMMSRPHLALVDWNMPNMNGLQFIRAIRADASYDTMKIVMVTTEVEMHHITISLEAGANEYVMKPFTEESLRDKLAMLGLDREAA